MQKAHSPDNVAKATDDTLDQFESERPTQALPAQEARFAVRAALDRACDEEAQILEEQVGVPRCRSKLDRPRACASVLPALRTFASFLVIDKVGHGGRLGGGAVNLVRRDVDIERGWWQTCIVCGIVRARDEGIFGADAFKDEHEELAQGGGSGRGDDGDLGSRQAVRQLEGLARV